MPKWVTAVASVFGTALAGKVVDYFFPTVFPKLISWLLLPVPAWLPVLALIIAAAFCWAFWRAASKLRSVQAGAVHPVARPAYRPGAHEDLILKMFGGAGGAGLKQQLDQHIPDAAAAAGLTTVELEHAVEALRNADWLEDTFESPSHHLRLRLSPDAARYCRAKGWFNAPRP
ncbi:hypothetical protein PWP89_16295 [Stenotrophomonas rhizophila]|uniref:hypothetical protein n=1 Tax=Stenotrophomonas rhizophila TaxID=216778 RepID=UPI0011813B68|nr:hypothetical protein [Stenotrophomonas rhizophila]